METVSIITITYNNAQGLEKTIKSVINQTYKLKEFIIIDGGSTDETKLLASRYKEEINSFTSEPDYGIYDALNKGIRKAKGEWIVCMNAGDLFASNDVLDKVFGKGVPANKSFIYSDYSVLLPNGKIVVKESNRKRGLVFHQSSIYRRSLHYEYGFYIVTKPYTVSDLMFFLAVPEDMYQKTDTVISLSDTEGISNQGLWCARDALCLRIIYGMENIHIAYLKYLKYKMTEMFRSFLPTK